ncbi:EamA family transporter [Nocardia bovistercoris]|uniref:DMT family transporter n=1 Tax=Nocardia bovistercoris TaxID=2785916 RepID=A0A931N0R1_9NOCA|nr:DMT family transporter [Nocardia bovistercoris]
MARAHVGVGVWLTVASGLAFATSGPFAKAVLSARWSPGATLAIRLTGAAAIILALALVLDRRALFDSRRHLRTLAVFGVVALAGVQATFFLALEYLQVGVALMIQFLAPIAVIGWNWLVRARRPSAVTLLGATLAICGAALVIDVFDSGGLDVVGLGWALLSMAGNAAFFILSDRGADTMSPVVLLGAGMTVAAVTAWALALIHLLPLRFGTASVTLAEHRVPTAVSLALLVMVSTVAAYLCGVAGAARIGSTLTSLILLSEVLFAVALSWLLLGESVAPIQVAGGVVLIGGIVLARRGTREQPPLPEGAAPNPVRT